MVLSKSSPLVVLKWTCLVASLSLSSLSNAQTKPTQTQPKSVTKAPAPQRKAIGQLGLGIQFGSQVYSLKTTSGRVIDIASNQNIFIGHYSYLMRQDWGFVPLTAQFGFGKNSSTSTVSNVSYLDRGSDILLAGVASGMRIPFDKGNILLGPDINIQYIKVDFQSLPRGASISEKTLYFGYGLMWSWRFGKWTFEQGVNWQFDQAGRSNWKVGVSYLL